MNGSPSFFTGNESAERRRTPAAMVAGLTHEQRPKARLSVARPVTALSHRPRRPDYGLLQRSCISPALIGALLWLAAAGMASCSRCLAGDAGKSPVAAPLRENAVIDLHGR